MGKQSKRKSRRDRHEARETGLRITVGVAPHAGPSGEVSLQHELRMVRSSLLYADQIELLAPGLTWAWTMAPLRNLKGEDRLRQFSELPADVLHRLGVPNDPQIRRDFRRELRSAADSEPDSITRTQMEARFRGPINDLSRIVETQLNPSDAEAFEAAIDSGAVALLNDGFDDLDIDSEEQFDWFSRRLAQALNSPETQVLLDPFSTELIRSGNVRLGSNGRTEPQARRATAGTGLIERLPAFPDAPMTMILEAREQLTDSRRDYRRAIKSYAAKLDSLAWDDTLAHELDELWYDEVQPAIKKIRTDASATRVARETGKALVSEAMPSTLTLASVTSGAVLDMLIPASLGGAGVAIFVKAVQQAMRARAARDAYDLVYLLHLDKQLK